MNDAENPPRRQEPPEDAAPAAPQEKEGGRGGCLWLFLVLCIIGVAVYGVYRLEPQLFKRLRPAASPAAPPPVRRVTVAAAKARRGDLPIYLEAPGTVTALDTVTVRTRVDGQIMAVYYREGQMVKAGDLLVQIDPRPFEAQLLQAQGMLARDEALMQNAKLDLERYQEAGRAATQQQLDTARASMLQYEGAIKTDQGQIDNANLQLSYCRITAPIDGRIGLRLVDPGNIVHANDTTGLAVIARVEPITVVFSLAQDFLPRVLKAMGAGRQLPVDVMSRDKAVDLTSGTLAAVDSQIDPQTLTARFRARFANKNHLLFPNQAVSVRLLVETLKNVVLVPTAAVQYGPQGAYVYVVKADKTVEMRPITPGPIEGDTAVIERGIAPGETVVTAGVDNLAPGMPVNISEAVAPQAPQASAGGIGP